MIPYEEYLPLLPHEYTYAQFLSYEFDLWLYDSMILNMVSERYPRDEDYASDFDSDSIIDEDFDFEVPPWLFQELEGSRIQQKDDYLKIVFGSLDQDYDLDAIYVAPPISIIPKFSDSTMKIGEITCFLDSGYSASKNLIATENVNRGAILESGTVKDLESGSNDFLFGCNNWNTVKPETRMCGDASSLLDPEVKDEEEALKTVNNNCTFSELRTKTVNLEKEASLIPDLFLVPKIASDQFHHSRFRFAKLVSPPIVVPPPEKIVECVDFAFGCNDRIKNQAMKVDYETVKKPPDPAKQLLDHTLLSEIHPSTSVFSNNSTSRCTSSQVRLTWFDFLFTTPDLVHRVLFLFRLETNASSPKKTECDFAEKTTSHFTTSIDPSGTLREISNSVVELSIQSHLVSIPFRSLLFPSITNQISATILMFNDLFSCMVKLLFYVKLFSITSPEPPWDILLRRFQPHDPGDIPVQRRGSISFGFQKLLAASWLLALPWASHALFGLQLGFWPIF